ncbi:MAG: TldD/PmbA family protein [Treponema sp.]|nr:TldD/PmbA family protein [Treponema sp.]
MLNKEKAREITQKLISYTKNHADVAMYNAGQKLTRFANSEIHQNVEIENTIVSLTVSAGKKQASCQSNVFDDESLKKLASDADTMLAFAQDGEFDLIPTEVQDIPETKNDSRLAETYDIKGRTAALKRCVASLDKDYTTAGAISLDSQMNVFASSSGAFCYGMFDSVRFSAVVTHKDEATGYGAVQANSLENCTIDKAFGIAYDKAKAAINPEFTDLGAYTVILEPAAVGNLLMFLLMSLNGARYQKGLSFASGKLGEKLFGDNFTVNDDVTNPATMQRLFDGEGNRRQAITLIEKGVLKNVLHCARTAQKAGVKPTGHATGVSGDGGMPLNVIMSGGDSSMPEMISSLKKGILVTHFHYCNFVNPKTAQLTGLTRDGTFLIEDGKISKPLRNMRFTEGLLNAFSNIKALSKDLTIVPMFTGPALLPSVIIEDFHFTSGQKT